MSPQPQSPGLISKEIRGFTSHDPACDQCRVKKIGCGRELPSCSNCVKAKVKCVRSDKGKRPNQVNRLVNDLDKVGDRLATLESSVNLIHRRLDDFFQSISQRQPIGTAKDDRTREHGAMQIPRLSMQDDDDGLKPPLHDTFSSSTAGSSLMALFEAADDKITVQLDKLAPRATLRDSLRRGRRQVSQLPSLHDFLAFKSDIYRGLPLATHTARVDLSNDGTPLLLPPKRLLDPIVEPYFRHISSVVPLIGRQACLEAIEQCYGSDGPSADADPAWVILFNYIILFCFVGQYMPLERPSTDVDVVSITRFEKPFVTNIRRSFAIINHLLTPRLVNVQALLALTLISQRYFSEYVTQYLLNQTCFVAKCMGLHEQRDVHDELTTDDINERRRVFSCLFIVDKDVSMLLGTPPYLHHQDCDVACPLQATYDYRLRLDASILFGKIYSELYSPAAARASPSTIEQRIDELLTDLDSLQCSIDNVSPKEADSMGRQAWQFLKLEQEHFVHHARLMVLRCSSHPAKHERRLLEARQCIGTMGKIRAARPTVGGFMILRRPFQWRPFAAFFELLPCAFAYPIAPEQLHELDCIKELVSMLRFVTSADDPSSYCGKILSIAEGCIAIADEFVRQCLCHQSVTSTLPPSLTNRDLLRKRKASPTPLSSRGRPPTRCRAVSDHQSDELRMTESAPSGPSEAMGSALLGYNAFNDDSLRSIDLGGLQDGFLSLLDDELFWGDGV